MTRPPAQLLAAYDLDPGCLRLLRGGQGTAWSAGNLILNICAAGQLSGCGWRAVAADHLPAGAPHLAGPVRVDGELPAHLVQHHVLVPSVSSNLSGWPGWSGRRPGGAGRGAVRNQRRAGRSRPVSSRTPAILGCTG